MPVMNFRLAQPRYLVDIFNLAELGTYQSDGNSLLIGATNTQNSVAVEVRRQRRHHQGGRRKHCPMAGCPQSRNRGQVTLLQRSVCGMACAGMCARRDADVAKRSADATAQAWRFPKRAADDAHRAGRDPHHDPCTRIAEALGLLYEGRPQSRGFRLWPARSSRSFAAGWRAVLFGVGSGPQRLMGIEQLLGSAGRCEDVQDIVRREAEVTPDDAYGSAAYRLHLAAGVVDKVVREACSST